MHANNNIPEPRMMDLLTQWRKCSPAVQHPLTEPLQLEPYSAAITSAGDLAIPLFEEDLMPMANLLLQTNGGKARLYYPSIYGQYAVANDYFDARRLVVTESYLSALVLAARCEALRDSTTYVIAAITAENIPHVLRAQAERWPHIELAAAPDTPECLIPTGVPIWRPVAPPEAPPWVQSWVDLHKWEVAGCQAA